MTRLIVDPIEDCRGQETEKGWEWERVVIVDELPMDGIDPYALPYWAGQVPGVPQIGDEWPGETLDSSGGSYKTICLRRVPQVLKAGTVKFTCYYGPQESGTLLPGYTEWSVRGSLVQVQTNKDANGNAVSVSYTYPSSTSDPNYPHETPALAGKTRTYADLRSVLRPEDVLVAKRVVATSPLLMVRQYRGRTNAANWSVDPTAPAGVWLCKAYNADSQYGGVRYVETFEFQYREGGWNPTVYFQDATTGKVPSDLVEGTGYKVVTDHLQANFNLLGL